jgi:hypothetical protein
MRRRGIARFWVHTATVETFKGVGSAGDIFAPPVTLTPGNGTTDGCFLDDGTKLVRNKDGDEVVSTTRLFTDKGNAALFTPNSRVKLPTRTARVISANSEDSGDLGLPDHLAVALT